MKKKMKINKYFLIGLISVLLLFVVLIVVFNKKEETLKFNLNEVSHTYKVDDEEGMLLYNRYQVEEGILFNFVGSNSFDDSYGYYYSGKVLELSNFIKNIILIKDSDYGTWDYDMDSYCYKISIDEFKNQYYDFYHDKEVDLSFDDKYNNVIIVDDNNICIKDTINGTEYTKVVDTYLINIVRLNGKIIIYERVAFIKTGDKSFKFYKDSEMKDLVYELKRTDEVDISFINNSELVSNVLLEYADKFDIYTYTYTKGENGYYLESIKK